MSERRGLKLLPILPGRLNRRLAAAALGGMGARELQQVEIGPGYVERGAGIVRPDFATGESATVISAGVFTGRAGRPVLVWATAGGSWKLAGNPGAAYEDEDFEP